MDLDGRNQAFAPDLAGQVDQYSVPGTYRSDCRSHWPTREPSAPWKDGGTTVPCSLSGAEPVEASALLSTADSYAAAGAFLALVHTLLPFCVPGNVPAGLAPVIRSFQLPPGGVPAAVYRRLCHRVGTRLATLMRVP